MAEVNITINGRSYSISCQDGQEQRVRDLGYYVDSRIREIARAGAAANESHLLVLTTLMLADEIFDLRDDVGTLSGEVEQARIDQDEEALVVEAISSLAGRIDTIAKRIQGL